MKCEQHKPIYDHAAPALAAVRCERCKRRWFGNPQAPNTPRWVKDGLEEAIARLREKVKPAR